MSLLLEKAIVSPLWPNLKREACVDLKEWTAYSIKLKRAMRESVPFEISNVSEYLYHGTEKEVWDFFEDFPHPVPPFHTSWFEWKVPEYSNSEGSRRKLGAYVDYSRIGCLISSNELPDDLPQRARARWIVNCVPFMEVRGGSDVLVGTIIGYGINDSSDPVGPVYDKKMMFVFPGSDNRRIALVYSREQAEKMGSVGHSMIFPALLALSFLNCRNVEVSERRISAKLVAKHRKHGHPLNFTSHRVIEIQPVRKMLASQGCGGGHSRRAAAIMRGHFKDYRAGKGLFGKLKGLYWWDQQIRTDAIGAEYRLARSSGKLVNAWPELLVKKD